MDDDKSCMRCGQPVDYATGFIETAGTNRVHHNGWKGCIRALGDAVKRLEQVALYPQRTIPPLLGMHLDTVQTAEVARLDAKRSISARLRTDLEMLREELESERPRMEETMADVDYGLGPLSPPATMADTGSAILTREQAAEIREAALMFTHESLVYGKACNCGPCTRLRRALGPLGEVASHG